MYIARLKEMFQEVTIKKNHSLIPKYYHEGFLLFTNEEKMDYKAFLKVHEEIYQTPIQYEIAYDEETLMEQGEKVAARVWITTKRPNETPVKIEVILIARYKEGKLHRLWELTYPDWSQLPAFN
jgi:hypothetical protein